MPSIRDIVGEILKNRKEIARAFVAKYGANPDEIEQVEYEDAKGRSCWFIRKIDPKNGTRSRKRSSRFSTIALGIYRSTRVWIRSADQINALRSRESITYFQTSRGSLWPPTARKAKRVRRRRQFSFRLKGRRTRSSHSEKTEPA
jgi:hypothetical protein